MSRDHNDLGRCTRDTSDDARLVVRVRELLDRDGRVGGGDVDDGAVHPRGAGRRVRAAVVAVIEVG